MRLLPSTKLWSFEQMVAQYGRGPNAELGAAARVDPIANRENGVEVEVLQVARDPASALILNCCIECNSCPGFKLTITVDIAQVARDDGPVTLEQGSALIQVEPEGIPYQAYFEGHCALRRLVQHDLAVLAVDVARGVLSNLALGHDCDPPTNPRR